MPEIEIEIDGKKIKTQPGKMIIQVADEHDIYIPRFCYHKKLSIAANCRMCLVEVEKAPKTLPACATPINDGMKIFTQSAKTLESQRAVMEFLLINHPLDCPICDQGGQCELQDFSLGYGKDHSDFGETKRAVVNKDFGPLIATEMTRCIHCTRCVRFGKEIAGVQELGATDRGEGMQITTYVAHTVEHELSGNIIDLCPVGALLSKPFLYRARAWELKAMASIAPHDGVGSHIFVHTRRQEVMRVSSRACETINENWISDVDRFSYEGLAVDRLEKPMIKDKDSGEWREVSWSVALNYAADAIEKIKAAHGADSIHALLSPSSTLEEVYLIKQLFAHLGSPHLDYRLRSQGYWHSAPLPGLNMAIDDIENQQHIFLIGSYLRNDQPIIAHRVRKAALKGAKIHVLDCVRHPYTFALASETIVKPSEFVNAVSDLIKKEIIAEAELALIIMGEYAFNHPDAETIYDLLSPFAATSKTTLALLPEGANALGCHQLGAWQSSKEASASSPKAFLLHGIEPEFDVLHAKSLERDLLAADCVVTLSPFISDHLKKVSSVLLPSAAFTETSGSFINLAGDLQSFMGAVLPLGEARPAWKIFRVLGNLLNVPNFNFEHSEEILRLCRLSLKKSESDRRGVTLSSVSAVRPYRGLPQASLEIIYYWPDCRRDPLSRRAKALNLRANDRHLDALHVHPSTAQLCQWQEGQSIHLEYRDECLSGTVFFDERVAIGAVLVACGFK